MAEEEQTPLRLAVFQLPGFPTLAGRLFSLKTAESLSGMSDISFKNRTFA